MLLRSNNALKCLGITVIAACLLSAWPISLYADGSQAKKVLVLNSYHQGFAWSDGIMDGIRSELKKSGQNIQIDIEYMDTKRICDKNHYQNLYELYKHKFSQRDYDLILTSDDNAFSFVLKYHDNLFLDKPVVFCGLNALDKSLETELSRLGWITGSVEMYDIMGNIDLILGIHHDAKQIVVVCDNTVSSQKCKRKVQEAALQMPDSIKFNYLKEDAYMEDILAKVRALPVNSVVLLMSFFKDQEGKYYTPQVGGKIISENSSVPIYSAWDFYLGHGITGGLITNSNAQGKMGAKIALRILNSEKVSNIPASKKPANNYMFDYNELKRFNIKSSNLPENSIVINKPYSFYSEHKVLILSVFTSITTLTLIIFFLITSIVTRRRAERALRESQERMKAILKASPVGIGLVINRKLDWANEGMYHMTGYEQGSKIGQSVRILYPDDKEYNRVGRELYVGITKTGIGHVETRLVRKDGTTFYCRIQACNLDSTDPAKGQIIALTDISKTKLFEAQLLQACKMEAVGTLAGGISHDFNNLLQAIMGYTQILLLNKSKEDPEFAQLKQIEKSAQRGGALTRQLLTFSRNVESKPKPLNLNNEIKRTYTILKRTIPRMIDIELILEDDLKNINADPIQMEQILMNLGVNSRDAMPDGGRLIFETKNVVLDEEYFKTDPAAMPGEYVMLSIADTGWGMDEETMERIYEPFFTTKEVGKGTGLGLAMVYGIVESHGGYITSYSKPDEGTNFRIYFPVPKADIEMRASEKKEEEMQGGSETILLVDDEETVLDIAKSMLEHFGYTAITAESGEDAIEIFKKSNPYPDLVILDVGMPGMGGHKCLKEFLKIYPEIKVIIASGYPENGKVEKTVESGAAGFIAKPYRLTDMLKKVREILGSG